MSTSATRSRLIAARKSHAMVRFFRTFEEGCSNHGYVFDVGPRFFLFAPIEASVMRYNGFQCFRIEDVRKLEVPGIYAKFDIAALRKLGERKPKKPRVSLASIETLLTSAGREFPLISIHPEKVDINVCYIGKVLRVTKSSLTLLEIDPGAVWDAEPTVYRLNQITRIDFGGGYERALQLVGGPAPSVE